MPMEMVPLMYRKMHFLTPCQLGRLGLDFYWTRLLTIMYAQYGLLFTIACIKLPTTLGICISTHVGDLFFMEWIIILKDFNANIPLGLRVRETFELNQRKPAPSQLLPVFFQDLTGCKLVAIHLDRPMSYAFFQVPANFFFLVMTIGQEHGHW